MIRFVFILLACAEVSSAALAQDLELRIGTNLVTTDGTSLLKFESVSDAVSALSQELPIFVKDLKDCAELLAVPAGRENARDSLQQTFVIIQKLKVMCWALSQVPSSSFFVPAHDADHVTPGTIWTIMRYAMWLKNQTDANFKTLITFSKGSITCRNAWRCRLVAPDEPDYPHDVPYQMVDYELILAVGDTRFVMVTQMIYGRAGFVYGVRMEGGRVMEVFPVLE